MPDPDPSDLPTARKHAKQTKHLFGSTYQGYELPDGVWVPGAPYAPDPRQIWSMQHKQLRPATWEGKRVLDLAGNNGYHAIRALREGARRAVLVEQHPDAVRQAKRIAKAWGVDLRVRPRDIEKNEWHNQRWDVIFCHQVLYHLVQPITLLRRARASLLPGGVFFTYTRIAINAHDKHWEWVPNWDTMRRTLLYAGFSEVEIDGKAADVRMLEDPKSPTLTGQRKALVTARV